MLGGDLRRRRRRRRRRPRWIIHSARLAEDRYERFILYLLL